MPYKPLLLAVNGNQLPEATEGLLVENMFLAVLLVKFSAEFVAFGVNSEFLLLPQSKWEGPGVSVYKCITCNRDYGAFIEDKPNYTSDACTHASDTDDEFLLATYSSCICTQSGQQS